MHVDEHDKLVHVRWHRSADLISLVAKEPLQVVGAHVLEAHVSRQEVKYRPPHFILVAFIHKNIQSKQIRKLITIHIITIQRLSGILTMFYVM